MENHHDPTTVGLCPSFKVFNIGIRRKKRHRHTADEPFPYNTNVKNPLNTSEDKAGVDDVDAASANKSTTPVAKRGSERRETAPQETNWWEGPTARVFNDLSFPVPREEKAPQGNFDASTGVDACNDSRESAKHPHPDVIAKAESSVSFSTIEVREYLRTLGDHPDVAAGPPVSIDWTYAEMERMSIDEYEGNRGPRRESHHMRMLPNVRRHLLLDSGIDEKDMKATEKMVKKIQKQRSWTAMRDDVLPLAKDVEMTIQSAKRKLKRKRWRSHDQDIEARTCHSARAA